MLRSPSSPTPCRLARHALLVCVLTTSLGGVALQAQSRAARAAQPTQAASTGSAVDASSFTHFLVQNEQTRLVHRGEAVPVGRADDLFSSWLELPTRSVATAGVRSDEGGTRALVVLVDENGGGTREIPLPSARGLAQATPKLLAPRTRETAFAVTWFEGSSLGQRELFFAHALDDGSDAGPRFSRPVRLAGRAPGSQVALDAVTLADGRYLLTWSAYDGTDTEILYMVGDGESWSRPRRVHDGDDTPDSFPTLVATPAGAVVAWNSLEGHTYAVMTSTFDGEGWSAPRRLVAAPGVEPAWARGADRPLLSFRQRGQWVLVEAASDGSARRRTTAPELSERPTVLALDERGVVVRNAAAQSRRSAPEGAVVGRRLGHTTGADFLEWQP